MNFHHYTGLSWICCCTIILSLILQKQTLLSPLNFLDHPIAMFPSCTWIIHKWTVHEVWLLTLSVSHAPSGRNAWPVFYTINFISHIFFIKNILTNFNISNKRHWLILSFNTEKRNFIISMVKSCVFYSMLRQDISIWFKRMLKLTI